MFFEVQVSLPSAFIVRSALITRPARHSHHRSSILKQGIPGRKHDSKGQNCPILKLFLNKHNHFPWPDPMPSSAQGPRPQPPARRSLRTLHSGRTGGRPATGLPGNPSADCGVRNSAGSWNRMAVSDQKKNHVIMPGKEVHVLGNDTDHAA